MHNYSENNCKVIVRVCWGFESQVCPRLQPDFLILFTGKSLKSADQKPILRPDAAEQDIITKNIIKHLKDVVG